MNGLVASLQVASPASFRTWAGWIGFVEHLALLHGGTGTGTGTGTGSNWTDRSLGAVGPGELVSTGMGGGGGSGDEQGERAGWPRGTLTRECWPALMRVSLDRAFGVSRATSRDGIMSETCCLGAPVLGQHKVCWRENARSEKGSDTRPQAHCRDGPSCREKASKERSQSAPGGQQAVRVSCPCPALPCPAAACPVPLLRHPCLLRRWEGVRVRILSDLKLRRARFCKGGAPALLSVLPLSPSWRHRDG